MPRPTETPVWPANPESVAQAAQILRDGGLVAFPTETVYGLGANALNSAAVAAIFVAKGRPSTNPVIVHLAAPADVHRVASEWPPLAAKLAEAFWPGPLTLVLPKSAAVPEVVTAGGPTVAVRCPHHPVAQSLLRAAGVPLAAPSANRSTELSPTLASHVYHSLNGRIDAILDGGPCSGGIESTVVEMCEDRLRILRPGLVTPTMLEAVTGSPILHDPAAPGVARSPGLMAKHYSPRTPLRLARTNAEAAVLHREGFASRWLSWGPFAGASLAMPTEPSAYASCLYAILHECDAANVAVIVVTLPPELPVWAAIRDRLFRGGRPKLSTVSRSLLIVNADPLRDVRAGMRRTLEQIGR